MALIVLFDARAFGPVALFELRSPRRNDLLGDHRMIEAAVIAFDEPAQRITPEARPCLGVAAKVNEAHQHRVIVGQAPRRDLVP